ncbi:hypothetical protein SO694_00048235 [Aureococcus anophagefferens]|uniref:Sulfotransferase domain-containing protein n=1 Tax=Aureococcus anophagefferens TaxID=44056 RepID=A0ABR1G8H9_AURAN
MVARWSALVLASLVAAPTPARAYGVLYNASAPTVNCNGSPKSGTTLLEYIVYSLYERSGRTSARCDLRNKHSLPAALPPFQDFSSHIDPAFSVLAKCKIRGVQDLWSKACVSRRYVNASELADLRFLVIVRDPRDTTQSWIEWSTHPRPGANPGMHPHFAKWATENAAIISLRYVWAQALGVTNPTMVIFYEDLMADKVAQIFRIASFLDADVGLEDVLAIVNATEPDHMREEGIEVGRGHQKGGIVSKKIGTHHWRSIYDNATVCLATKGLVGRAHPALRLRWLRDHPDDRRFLDDPGASCGD